MEIKTIQEPEHNFKYYCKPAVFTKLIANKKIVFCSWALFGYVMQFLLCISALNVYSDKDRHLKCGKSQTDPHIDPSSYYDAALFLMAVYHMIEFVRFTLFMTCAFIEVNLIQIWYALGINTLFGLASYLYVHGARFSEDGKACADVQKYRGTHLMVEVIVFWPTFIVMSIPQLFIKCMKKETIEACIKENNGEEEEESEESIEKKQLD